jgi:magnesium chelatase family protein
VRESSFRISAALNNNSYKLPGKKIIINMAPADIRKEGAAYDLTLAVGILAASHQIKSDTINDYIIKQYLLWKSLDFAVQDLGGNFLSVSNYFLERSSLVCVYQVLFLGKIVKIE